MDTTTPQNSAARPTYRYYEFVMAAFVAVHWRFFAHRDAAMPVAAEAAAPGPTRQAER